MKKRIFKKSRPKAVEEKIEDIQFNIHKFNNRPRPTDKRLIMMIGCFSEFGCEIVGCMYCIPRTKQIYPGRYTIAVGWYGREYLYRHLVDEFWEIKEEHQWLRDYCNAFHHSSKNLKKLEHSLAKHGVVFPSSFLGSIAMGNICNDCKAFWGGVEKITECVKCKSKRVVQSIMGDTEFYKPQAIRIPTPSEEKMEKAKTYLKSNPVGVFARDRITYGRNLQPEFYVKLIESLEKMGYDPIWLGEKQNTLECPVDHIIDMSRKPEARDLELTLAIVSQLKFTVQFWTASTRLAAITGVPYLLFESPEQIFGSRGQEGIRINLVTFGPKKLCISHYLNVYNDHDAGIDLVERCVNEMEAGNYKDVIGLIDSEEATKHIKKANVQKVISDE